MASRKSREIYLERKTQTDREISKWIDKQMSRLAESQINKWKDGWIDRWMNKFRLDS